MKAILEFNLDSPEDQEKFKVASRATDWYLVVSGLDNEMRDLLKYHNAHADVEVVRKKLHDLMEEYGVSLEDMS